MPSRVSPLRELNETSHVKSDGIRDGATEDAVSQAITSLAKLHGKSLHADEWRQVEGLWYFRDKIYILNILDLQ